MGGKFRFEIGDQVRVTKASSPSQHYSFDVAVGSVWTVGRPGPDPACDARRENGDVNQYVLHAGKNIAPKWVTEDALEPYPPLSDEEIQTAIESIKQAVKP